LDSLLTTKVREYGLQLRKLDEALRYSESLQQLAARSSEEAAHKIRYNALRRQKEQFLGEVYNILSVTLGVPPRPEHTFTWDYYDKDGHAKSWTGTPVEFYKAFSSSKYPHTEAFSLINDPRNEYDTLYTVDKLGNVWGGQDIRYVNTTSDRLKQSVITTLKAGQPVFFGCDVGKHSNTPLGIMDVELFDYERAFGVKLGLTKKERLQTGESAMTHAMVITAVHLDGEGKPIRWKVENSWGDGVGDHGFFVMTDRWFDEFVFQVVTPKTLASKDLLQVLEKGEKVVLPAWDPMGALA